MQKELKVELERKYGGEWIKAFENACNRDLPELEQMKILRDYAEGIKGYPILFALTWHSRAGRILRDIFNKNIPCGYIYYALACNTSTPKEISEDLLSRETDDYLKIRKRVEERLRAPKAEKEQEQG